MKTVVALPPLTVTGKESDRPMENVTVVPHAGEVIVGGAVKPAFELITNSIAAEPLVDCAITCVCRRPPAAGGVIVKTPVSGSTAPLAATFIVLSAVVASR